MSDTKFQIIKGGKDGGVEDGASSSKVKDDMGNTKLIKIVRFISGEEIITTVVNQNDKKILVEKSLVMMYKPSGEGQISIGFGPFMPYSEGQVALSVSAVAAIADPMEKIVEEYNRIFSPIIQPSPGIVNANGFGVTPSGPVGPKLVP